MNQPAPYSSQWWRQQPPEPLAATVTRFQESGHQQSPRVRAWLARNLPPLAVAEQIDRDMRRLGVLP